MYPYLLVIRDKEKSSSLDIRGAEAAYDRYRMASLALAPQCSIDLCDAITGEVLESSSEDWD